MQFATVFFSIAQYRMATSSTITSNVVAKSLTQRFPVKRFALAAVLLSSVALLGFISLNLVKGKAHLIVDGTLPGPSGGRKGLYTVPSPTGRPFFSPKEAIQADGSRTT